MDRRGFARRLRAFVTSRYGSLYALALEPLPEGPRQRGHSRTRKTRFPYPTLKKWAHKTKPQCPIDPSVVQFAEVTGVSLDWLVFGSGDELRGVNASPEQLGALLRQKVEAELLLAGFGSSEVRQVTPAGGAQWIEETVDYWVGRAERDRRVREERFAGYTNEQVKAVVRTGIQYLAERGDQV